MRSRPSDEGSSHTAHLEDLDAPDATFAADLTSCTGLDELELEVTGRLLGPGSAVLACRVVEPSSWCRRYGWQGVAGHRRPSAGARAVGLAAHHAAGHRSPLPVLRVRVRVAARYFPSRGPRVKLSRAGLRCALVGIVTQHLSIARVADGHGVAWGTANDAVLAEGRRVLIDHPHGFHGVATLGVDAHVWRHARRGDKYGTVIIDLTAVLASTVPARAAGHGRRPLQACRATPG